MTATNAAPTDRLRFAGSDLARFFNSIKGKIFIIFAVTFLSVGGLTLINFWSLTTVKDRLLLGERYDDLLNNILELRRFEKNYLFYNDKESLKEGIAYLTRIDEVVGEISSDMVSVSGEATFRTFLETLRAYEKTMQAYELGAVPDGDEIRLRGKALVDFADKLLSAKRARIHRTIVRASVLPFAFLGVFALLMVALITLISRGLLSPLHVVRETTRRVARGDFSPIPYDDRRIEEIAGLIEAFNRMARELEVHQEDLLQARKIAALGTFTAGVAHELNNPINNISLTAEAFIEEYGDKVDQDGSEMLQDIVGQAERASDIVRSLLDFSRTERPAFSKVDPIDIVRTTLALARNQVLLSGVRLETNVPEGLPSVRGDMRNLQQVFMNLLLNALQAMRQGGVVSVSVAEENGFVRFDVRDTGEGIDPDALHHIFEPFFTTKEVGRGTGLGLSVSYAIVKRHGGRIEVKSEPGRGSLFSVYLPKADPLSAASASAAQEA